VDQLPQRVLVGAERIGGIESAQPAPAQLATAFLVERRRVDERRPALHAEVLGVQGPRVGQTGVTHRDTRYVGEGFAADAAVIGEEEVEKGRRNLAD